MKPLIFLLFTLLLTNLHLAQSRNDELRLLEGHLDGDETKEKIYGGGTFRLNEVEGFRNLFPHSLVDACSYRIASQVYQGLLRFDPESLEIVPGLAEAWSLNEDGTKYTFHLRKGVFFHDNACFPNGKGRELNASDVAHCFTQLCTFSRSNLLFEMFHNRIVGANEYFEASQNGSAKDSRVKGVRVVDDYTVELSLTQPFAPFLNVIAHNACWIYPLELIKKYGPEVRVNCVGTGPFIISKMKEGELVVLKRNPNYWERDEFGNQLPYLDTISISFIPEKKLELLGFYKGELDLLFKLPVEEIGTLIGGLSNAKDGLPMRFQYQSMMGIGVQYYGLLHTSVVFENIHVRKAFNYAIDRHKLVDYTLQGEGHPSEHGFLARMPGFDDSKVKGFTYNPEKAREELALANYPNGKGFPEVTIYINNGGVSNTIIAESVRQMLEEVLNVKISIHLVSFSTLIEQFTAGKCDIWRTGWIVDYPDPENMLKLFYGKTVPKDPNELSFPNAYRYQNPKYDSIFELAMAELDADKRESLYQKCDQLLVDDAAYLALYHDENIRLLGLDVRNMPQNGMEYRDFTKVFFTKSDANEKE
ncbi:MAG: ABC transporter substrate-binding protein [Flavobacteriales bacterium]|nr:ABC transporter substrate-binding protein [Flavobacteriales bacterium]